MTEEEKATVQGTEGAEESEQTDSFNRTYVEGLRGEAADWRTKLRDSEKNVENLANKLKSFEDAQKSELERVTEEKTNLEQQLKDLVLQAKASSVDTAIRLEASNANVNNVEDVLALIDREGIEYNDGSVTGVQKALKKLLKDRAYLVKGEEKKVPPTPGVGGESLDGSTGDPLDNAFLGLLQSAQPDGDFS